MRIRRANRNAFTITEMMVATALILFIMAIISQVFGSASKTYTQLRVAGMLQERTRTTSVIIRRDLTAEKFDGPFIPGRSGPRLGDQRLDQPGWMPPQAGYVEILQGGPSLLEPTASWYAAAPVAVVDGESMYSSRATNHAMRFTVKLPKAASSELFTARGPARFANDQRTNSFVTGNPVIYSQWAEVAYFMVANGETTPGGLPLYSLRRRIRVLFPTTVDFIVPDAEAAQIAAGYNSGAYPDLMPPIFGASAGGFTQVRAPGVAELNKPTIDMTTGAVTPDRMPIVPHPSGDDMLTTDVLSFEIKASWLSNNLFQAYVNGSSPPIRAYGSPPVASGQPNDYYVGFSEGPFEDLTRSRLNPSYLTASGFDTWRQPLLTNIPMGPTSYSPSDNVDYERPQSFLQPYTSAFAQYANPPLRINVRTVQIKIRVYDPKAEQARQITIVQEL